MIRYLGAATALLLAPSAYAQDKCATVTVSTTQDIAALLADAECYAKAMVSAANSQALRLAKARKLAKPAPTPSPSPAPSPTATPAPSPTPPPAPGSVELAPIASNFDTTTLLLPSWGTGEIAKPADDTVGAFRFICAAGHLSYDDPLVYPGQPGKSHLHQWFGNTLADAFSTYASLRTTGDSTCNNPLNRSAYWIPAMLDGNGGVVRPGYLVVYYKRFPKDSPYCTLKGKGCVDLPRGLRFIFGYNMLNPGEAPTGAAYWTCQGGTAPNGVHVADLNELRRVCIGATQIGAAVVAPECWDGANLDSTDHRSHVGYMRIDPNDGQAKCPATHPWIIPAFSLSAWYSVDANLPDWHLSSDVMGASRHTPGSTLHSDWFGAWDDPTLATWHANCIDKKLSCAGGDLGNGTQMRQDKGYSYKAEPRVVAVP